MKKIKNWFKGIMWPSLKTVQKDTIFTVVVTAILSITIGLWISGIEQVVNFIAQLF